MISGCTSSGKTTFVKKLLEHPELIEPRPQKILYCYGVWQRPFDEMKSTLKDIEFHGGLPDSELIANFVDGKHNIVVLDDLMSDIVKDEDMQQLFTRGSHHMNLTILYLTQTECFLSREMCQNHKFQLYLPRTLQKPQGYLSDPTHGTADRTAKYITWSIWWLYGRKIWLPGRGSESSSRWITQIVESHISRRRQNPVC